MHGTGTSTILFPARSTSLQADFKPLLFFCAAPFLLCGAGGGVLLAHLRCVRVRVVLGCCLAVEEHLEEVCLRGRQRLCPHGHRLYVFLKRFSFLKGVLHGAVEQCLGLCGLLALLLVEPPRPILSLTHLGEGLHGLVGCITLGF